MPTNQELLSELKDQVQDLKDELGRRDQRTTYVDARIDSAAATMQTALRTSFDADTVKHREYIISLYSKFERLVYLLVLLAIGIVTYFGFRFSDMPESIDRKVANTVATIATKLDNKLQTEMIAVERKVEDRVADLTKQLETILAEAKGSTSSIKASRSEATTAVTKLNAIVRDANGERLAARKNYKTILIDNRRTLDNVKLELALLSADATLPDTVEDINKLWDTIDLAATKPPKLDKLMRVFSVLPDAVFDAHRSSMRETFGRILFQKPGIRTRLAVLRAGLLLGHRKTEDTVRTLLGGEDTLTVSRTIDLFGTDRTTRIGGLRTRRVRRNPEAGLFFDELEKLGTNVAEPELAEKAVDVLRIGELTQEQRNRLNGILGSWLKAPRLAARLVARILPRLPLDENTSRLYRRLFAPRSGLDSSLKREATRRVISRLAEVRGEQSRSFVRTVGRDLVLANASEQDKLGLTFATGQYKRTERLSVVGGAVVGRGGKGDELRLKVGDKELSLSGVMVTVNQDGSWEVSIETLQIDGERVGRVVFPKSRKRRIYKDVADSVVLSVSYRHREEVEMAVSVAQ